MFITAFVAATILPAQSEALLAALMVQGAIHPFWLVSIASLGNIMGSCVNWLLGWYIERFKTKKWFPVNAAQLERAQTQYQKYGRWSLLLSWVPIIGDPITVVAGIMRERFWVFLTLVSIAKTARYAFITVGIIWLSKGG